jgi:inorganic pyrophosphatase
MTRNRQARRPERGPARKRVPRSLEPLDAYEGEDLSVVIETAKGSQNKYAYEPRFAAFVLKGVLPAGAVFPFDFGFVPSTLGEDGDPLDILVLMDAPAFAGCIVPSRLIGAIKAEQTEDGKTERNDRLLAVASHCITHKSIQDIEDISEDLLGQIEALLRLLQPDQRQEIQTNRARRACRGARMIGQGGPPRQAALMRNAATLY